MTKRESLAAKRKRLDEGAGLFNLRTLFFCYVALAYFVVCWVFPIALTPVFLLYVVGRFYMAVERALPAKPASLVTTGSLSLLPSRRRRAIAALGSRTR